MSGEEDGWSSEERPNPRKRSFAELCTRPPRRAHHLPLPQNPESVFARAPSESLNRIFPPPRPRRYEGDGLDLRRPVMSQQHLQPETRQHPLYNHRTNTPSNFIDLTSENDTPMSRSRSQASGNSTETAFRWPFGTEVQTIVPARTPEIIDLEDDVDDDVVIQGVVSRPPEVEFVSEQTRMDRPPRSRDVDSWFPSMNNRSQWFNAGVASVQGLLSGTDATSFRSLAHAIMNQGPTSRPRTSVYDYLEGSIGGIGGMAAPYTDWGQAGEMDVTQVAFDLNSHRDVTTPRSTARFDAPSTLPEGFTRTMQEDDVAICANCGHELGTGDSPVQKQIWVVRKCGHVYCGTCANGQGKNKKRLFNKCVVDGCANTAKLAKGSMFILYI